jgi:hypothetical protein
MTYGPCDLRLVEALAERRLLEARRIRVARERTPSARGAPPETSDGRGRVAVPRPAPGAAGHN